MSDLLSLLPLIFLALLALSAFVLWDRFQSWRGRAKVRAEAEEREVNQALTDEEMQLRRAAALWVHLSEAFPYLPKPTLKEHTAEALLEGVRESLEKLPSMGQVAGTDLPAPALPRESRRRHLAVFGKTGSGKSTFLEHLVVEDLKAGRGVCVAAPEGELFRRRLLPLLPKEREDDLIYFAPGDPKNPLSLNPLSLEPGEDQARAAEDLFTIFKRILGEDALGVRMQPILQNAFAALVGRPGATLLDVKRLLEDGAFRKAVVLGADRYVRSFFEESFPRFPKGAAVPIIHRLDRFLRPPATRRVLCRAESSFSIQALLKGKRVLFLDLFGLSEENRSLFGQLVFSKFQLELMRRELSLKEEHPLFYLYADEFPTFAGVAVDTWRELLSRGRKYGLCLTLASQHPGQLPRDLRDEILGTVNSLMAFRLGGKDAGSLKREFLTDSEREARRETLEPLPASEFLKLRIGEAYATLAGGRAVKLAIPPPLRVEDPRRTRTLIEASWARLGESALPPEPVDLPHVSPPRPAQEPRETSPKPETSPPTKRLSKEILDYLEHLAQYPFLSVRERNRDLALSAWKGQRLKSKLLKDGLVVEVPVNPGGQGKRFKLLEFTQSGRELLVEFGLRPPSGHGRGGLKHQWWVRTIAEWLSEEGLPVSVEDDTSGARVDLASEFDGEETAIEVEVSDGHELENIRKDIEAGFKRVVSLLDNPDSIDRLRRELPGTEAEILLGDLRDFRALLAPLLSSPLRAPNQDQESRGRRRRSRPRERELRRPRVRRVSLEEPGALPTPLAAEYLGLSPATLETLRSRGGGPEFVKLGRRVVYRREDLDCWLAEGRRRSTSDPGKGA